MCIAMQTIQFLVVVMTITCGVFSATLAAPANALAAEKKPVTDEYQGAKVEDNYQWLENDNDAAVKAWSDAQNTRTRAYIDKLPDRAGTEKQMTDWFAKTSPNY